MLYQSSRIVRQMGFVLDASTTMNTPMDGGTRCSAVREATWRAIQCLAECEPSCLVWVGTFNDQFRLWAGPMAVGPNLVEFERAISAIEAGGWTHFRPALGGAAQMFGLQPARGEEKPAGLWQSLKGALSRGAAKAALALPGRGECQGERILVFQSDGDNNGPDPLPIAEELKCCGVTIHTVGVATSPGEVNEELLKAIASWDQVGQRPLYTFIKDSQLLAQHFVSLARHLVVNI